MDSVVGQRVLITRAAEDCAAWASRLRDAGAVALMLPCIECRPIRDPVAEARLAEALPRTDWLVLTSRRGAEGLQTLIAAIQWSPSDLQAMANVLIATVGPATASAAASLPGRVELVAPAGTAKSLARELAARIATPSVATPPIATPSVATPSVATPSIATPPIATPRESGAQIARPKCLIAVAENAGPVLEDTLKQAGGECVRINVYRTVPAAPPPRKQALSELGADKILLASPSAVSGLVNRLEFDAAAEILTIGPATSQAVRAVGLTVTAEAPRPSLEGLMEAMQ